MNTDTKNAAITTFQWYGLIRTEENWVNGKREGLFVSWYDDGVMGAGMGTYKNGKKEGLFTVWNKYGQKVEEMNYKKGKREGLFVGWYDDGTKACEQTYKNGNEVKLQQAA